jgi:type III secretion system YscQ/HrcQ family protein
VEAFVRRVQPLADVRALDGGVAVALARAEAPDVARSLLVEAERALVATVLSHVLRRSPGRVIDARAEPTASTAGSFAAVVAAAARRAHGENGAVLRVLAAGPSAALEADLARVAPEPIALTLTVLVERDAFTARLVLSRDVAAAAPAPAWSASTLASLGAMPLALSIVAGATSTTGADFARLSSGDVFLPGEWRLVRAGGSERAELSGPVLLAAPSSGVGTRAELGGDGRLVLRGDLEPLCAAEAEMSETQQADGLVEALGEVPVVVRVEIGEARMAAREWASLGRGDVVSLGRRVGESVLLRVGGVPVARGELVEIDGEVGVRIVERLAGEATAS